MMKCCLYRHFAADPFFNMAFDECMLESVLRRPGLILLRLYTWREGAITFGCNQEIERAVCRSRLGGTSLIRRVTGGRAVYHDISELTYAVAVNTETDELRKWAGSVTSIYLRLAEGLQAYLDSTGIATKLVRRSSDQRALSVNTACIPCFGSAARYELLANGTKVVASAQRQVAGALLQHGSIKLDGVAAHPALPGGSISDAQPQLLTKSRFDGLAGRFGSALGRVLGCEPEKFVPIPIPAKSLRARLDQVRSEPLVRRDVFEHSATSISL